MRRVCRGCHLGAHASSIAFNTARSTIMEFKSCTYSVNSLLVTDLTFDQCKDRHKAAGLGLKTFKVENAMWGKSLNRGHWLMQVE